MICSRNTEKISLKQAIEQFVLRRVAHHSCNNRRSSSSVEIARVGGHYADQGHLTSPILVPLESPNASE